MRRPADPAARRALAAFAGAGGTDRFHVRARWWSCPFPLVEAAVPRRGRVLEVGCGHGLLSLYLAASAPERRVTGTDVDEGKLAVARAAAAALGGDVRFLPATPGRLPEGPWDAVVIVDVLYLLGPAAAGDLLAAAAAALVPGGVVVVKETGHRPRWKWALSAVQERVSTRLLRITEGDHVAFLDDGDVAAALAAEGLEVTRRRVDAGYPHPHHLVVGVRADRSSDQLSPDQVSPGRATRWRNAAAACRDTGAVGLNSPSG